MALTSAQEKELWDLITSGRKIEAIKRYREITGVGLQEALYAVTQIRPKGVIAAVTAAAPSVIDPKKLKEAEAAALASIREGNVLEALRRYRAHTQLDMRQSKEAVDALTVVHESGGRINSKLAHAVMNLVKSGKKQEAITHLMSSAGYDDVEARKMIARFGRAGASGCSSCAGGCLRIIFVLILLALAGMGACTLIVKNSTLYQCVEPKILASAIAKKELGEPLAISPWLFVQSSSGNSVDMNGSDASFNAYGRLSGPKGDEGMWIQATRQQSDATVSVTIGWPTRDLSVVSGSVVCKP